jgi:hypothetical protein
MQALSVIAGGGAALPEDPQHVVPAAAVLISFWHCQYLWEEEINIYDLLMCLDAMFCDKQRAVCVAGMLGAVCDAA